MEDEENEMPECPVCYELYTIEGSLRPRILKCGHGLCGICLSNKMIKICPRCRGNINKNTKINFGLIEAIKLLQQNYKHPKVTGIIITDKLSEKEKHKEKNKEFDEFKKLIAEEKEIEVGLIIREKLNEVERVTNIIRREKEREINNLRRIQERERTERLRREREEKDGEFEAIRKVAEYQEKERKREKENRKTKGKRLEIQRKKERSEIEENLQKVKEFEEHEEFEKLRQQIMEKQTRMSKKPNLPSEHEGVFETARKLYMESVDWNPPTKQQLLHEEHVQTKILKPRVESESSIFLPKNYTGDKGRKKRIGSTKTYFASKNEELEPLSGYSKSF